MIAPGVALIIVIVWVALSLGATLCIFLADSFPRERRLLFLLLTWILPVIGALLTILVALRARRQPSPPLSGDTMAIETLAARSGDSALRPDLDPP
jgi:hypothetical protein